MATRDSLLAVAAKLYAEHGRLGAPTRRTAKLAARVFGTSSTSAPKTGKHAVPEISAREVA